MQVLATVDIQSDLPRRRAERAPANLTASARQHRGHAEAIRIVDISTDGCGFESRWPFQEDMLVWLALPGLEPWGARVVWYREGRGGMQFTRALYPAVAARFAIGIADGNVVPLKR